MKSIPLQKFLEMIFNPKKCNQKRQFHIINGKGYYFFPDNEDGSLNYIWWNRIGDIKYAKK